MTPESSGLEEVIVIDGHEKKILLVEPPFHRLFKSTLSLDRYPLGLGYLAAAIRKSTDWSVKIYNADFCGASEQLRVSYLAKEGFANYRSALSDPTHPVWGEVRTTIETFGPRVVGISSRSPNSASAFTVAAIAKEVDPTITVVLGGPHASAVRNEALREPQVDVVARGEGERTIVELLDAVGAGRSLEGIAGIGYRAGDGAVENPPRQLIDDLDELPFPHEVAETALIDFDRHAITAFRYIFSSRGCPYACVFCDSRTTWGRGVRYRSTENILREIRGLRAMGLRFVHFSDDTFGVSRRRLVELCEAMIEEDAGMLWGCETHAAMIRPETVRLMKLAGCHSIEIGVESGNDGILKKIRKETTVEQSLAALETIQRAGIETVALFMVGFPDDTEETLADTFAAMKRARCDRIHYSIFTPYPGSESYEECLARGLIGRDYDPSLFGHQSPMNAFCQNVRPERFREIVTEFEKMVDRKNTIGRLRSMFTGVGWRRIRELGPRKGVRKAVRFFTGV